MTKYDIFRKCFADLDIPEDIFYKLIDMENVKCISYEENNQLIGYALIQKSALRLLCVLPKFQRNGIGTKLLEEAEEYIRSQREKEILTGGASSNLFIGALEDSVSFFAKRGFAIVGNCEEMKRNIQDFSAGDYNLSVPENTSFGWYKGSWDELLDAVSDVEPNWVQYYPDNARVFCGWCDGEISSFCLVDYDSECIVSNGNNKVGMIGCVGTVHKHRRKGIGLKMVALASEELKKNKCDACFIHYTGVAHWYAKLGYKTFIKEYFCRKELVK